ncbi:unnamed protein product, partial [Rotaria sp. Silwood1]
QSSVDPFVLLVESSVDPFAVLVESVAVPFALLVQSFVDPFAALVESSADPFVLPVESSADPFVLPVESTVVPLAFLVAQCMNAGLGSHCIIHRMLVLTVRICMFSYDCPVDLLVPTMNIQFLSHRILR